MVLEEASAGPEAFASDAPPTSDADPYHGDRNPTQLPTRHPSHVSISSGDGQAVHVRLDQLPKRWAFLESPEHHPQLVQAIAQSMQQAQQFLGRPLKQDEADALAFHAANTVRIASFGVPAGMAVASLWAYRGVSTFRFPGWTPGEKFNPDKFLTLQGKYARIMWQVTRFNAYWLLGSVLGQIFFGSYALTVGTAGRAMDPRLKGLMDTLQQKQKIGGLPGNRPVDQTTGPRQGETLEMARQRQRAQEAWRDNRARQQESRAAQAGSGADDMSPTGGAFGSEYIDLGSPAVSDTAMMSDDQARRRSEGLQRQQEASYDKSRDTQRSQAPRPQQEPARDAFSAQEESKAVQIGSAWDRLRQQAVASKSSPTPANNSSTTARAPSSSGGNDFTFSSGEEDRQLAKTEAQKDFDARIERERSGQDFNDQRRW